MLLENESFFGLWSGFFENDGYCYLDVFVMSCFMEMIVVKRIRLIVENRG